MKILNTNKLTGAIALALSVGLAGCAGSSLSDSNPSLNSVHQPVVSRSNFTLDVDTTRSGLSITEQQRLNGWFETMDLRYGDRVTVEDPSANPAVADAVNELAGRYGLIVSGVAPATPGALGAGQARVVITRSSASVPDCPNWSNQSDRNFKNETSANYGCAVNSNIAAMVANPEDLLEGQSGSGETTILTSTKAIETFREAPPTGAAGLLEANQNQGGGN
ncbi:CpaD family pilus assembly protein [Erythrobacter sp. SCSIO 43205]|uniref:CpaD family pilus assembly protein n=1 Tax=Erythrobacter sp. SCSIO 43205 TaxID=2779361 RepID=UPI001CA91B5D|nr:CpaD family pilus assembly protein [Erythrobacter sp. SCSIO 43205]UAB79118.1 CpaD family pilus assembly protein [Erythrobacter sp. SCSIO 43205]